MELQPSHAYIVSYRFLKAHQYPDQNQTVLSHALSSPFFSSSAVFHILRFASAVGFASASSVIYSAQSLGHMPLDRLSSVCRSGS